jgi:glucan phosphoethanolaminetransferase (alkaline phosphatase superfamily)
MQKILNNSLIKFVIFLTFLLILYKSINSVELDETRQLLVTIFTTKYYDLFSSFIFILTFLLGIFFILSGLLAKSRIYQLIFIFLIFITYFFDAVFLKAQGRGIQIPTIWLLQAEAGVFLSDFGLFKLLSAYTKPILEAFFRAILVTASLVLLSKLTTRYRFGVITTCSSFIIFILSYFATAINNGSIFLVPSIIKIPVLFLYVMLNQNYSGPRDDIYFKPTNSGLNKVVLIIDESVRGDYFSLNGYTKDTTPYLKNFKNIENFRIVPATSNCSWSSDLLMRVGTKLEKLPDIEQSSMKAPSIFQYAKANGYYTAFVDAQVDAAGGYMLEAEEIRYIDSINKISSHLNNGNTYKNDRIMAEKLVSLLKKHEKIFVIFNKQGTHLPYNLMYPEEEKFPEYLESDYEKAIYWAVDGFFKEYLDEFLKLNAQIIYTSDHGQSFEDAKSGVAHCDWVTPVASQANVPLILFGADSSFNFDANYSYSQFQVFPTLLRLLGYNQKFISKDYEVDLSQDGKHLRYFVAGNIFGEFGFKKVIFD